MSLNLASRRAAALGIAFGMLACSDANDPVSESKEAVSGSYITTVPASGGSAFGSLVFSTTENGATVDQVAEGAEIRLSLANDGTTSGLLHIPNVTLDDSEEPVTFDANLAGTWSLDGNTITLSHAADTFLRDMPLTVKGDRLEGDRTFGDVRVRLSLVRQ